MSAVSRIQELYDEGGTAEVSRGVLRKLACDVYPGLWNVWHRVADDRIEIALNGDDYVFAVDYAQELKRFKTLMGERGILEDFLSRLEDDDVVWDIGGNVGLYTVPAADRCHTVAFDPVPANTEQARKNLEMNGLTADLRTIGLGDSKDTVRIHIPKSVVDGGSSIAPLTGAKTISAPVYPGDELVAEGKVPSPTVVKIDVEGAESMVIDGMMDTLSSVRLVLVEVHGQKLETLGSSIADVVDKLEAAGFEVSRISNRHEENYHVLGIAE